MTCQFCSGKIEDETHDFIKDLPHNKQLWMHTMICENGCINSYKYVVDIYREPDFDILENSVQDPSGRSIYV